MTPIDVGISVANSSAAQSGSATTGGFSVSGSNAIPIWVWIALGVAVLLVFNPFKR